MPESNIGLGGTETHGRRKSLDSVTGTGLVPRSNIPVDILSGMTLYDCRHGRERHESAKKKYASKREKEQNVDHPVPRQRRQQMFGTLKVNCEARIEVKETFVFKNVQIPEGILQSFCAIGEFRNSIKSGNLSSPATRRFYVKLPLPAGHSNHPSVSVSVIQNNNLYVLTS